MTNRVFLVIMLLTFCQVANSAEHHSGHGGAMGGGGGGASCVKPHLSKFTPAHLSTVAPGAEFSFVAVNVHKPEQITVKVKNNPVPVVAEFKDPFYLVKGRLPESLRNTAARITIKVTSKSPHCEAENGWLVTITE